jgi:hypothetical protein
VNDGSGNILKPGQYYRVCLLVAYGFHEYYERRGRKGRKRQEGITVVVEHIFY